MRSLVAVAVRRRVSVIMAALAVVAFGIVAYDRLAVELFPDISYPSLTIQTNLPDTAPQEVENLVTRPVEEAVGVLRGLQTIHSVSRPGISEVTLEFDWNSDMDLLSLEVREKLDRLILRRVLRGSRPLVFAVHTFTSSFEGRSRRFDAGVLFERDRGLARTLGRRLRIYKNCPT